MDFPNSKLQICLDFWLSSYLGKRLACLLFLTQWTNFEQKTTEKTETLTSVMRRLLCLLRFLLFNLTVAGLVRDLCGIQMPFPRLGRAACRALPNLVRPPQ